MFRYFVFLVLALFLEFEVGGWPGEPLDVQGLPF